MATGSDFVRFVAGKPRPVGFLTGSLARDPMTVPTIRLRLIRLGKGNPSGAVVSTSSRRSRATLRSSSASSARTTMSLPGTEAAPGSMIKKSPFENPQSVKSPDNTRSANSRRRFHAPAGRPSSLSAKVADNAATLRNCGSFSEMVRRGFIPETPPTGVWVESDLLICAI